MGRHKKRKSPFSKYKTAVKWYLCAMHRWPGKTALAWLNRNIDYIRSEFEEGIPPQGAAKVINGMGGRDVKS